MNVPCERHGRGGLRNPVDWSDKSSKHFTAPHGRPSPAASLAERIPARNTCCRRAARRSCRLSCPKPCLMLLRACCSCDCEKEKKWDSNAAMATTRQLMFLKGPRYRQFVESTGHSSYYPARRFFTAFVHSMRSYIGQRPQVQFRLFCCKGRCTFTLIECPASPRQTPRSRCQCIPAIPDPPNQAAYPCRPPNAPLRYQVINALKYMQRETAICRRHIPASCCGLFLAASSTRRALVLVAASLAVVARLVLTRLVDGAALSDAVIMAFPNHVGVCWQRQDAFDGFPAQTC